jgi:predicted nicotinamide N-methyase
LIRNKAILDLASHDGRWSFAAHHAGARSVLGGEMRDRLVRTARETLALYGVGDDKVSFIRGDVDQVLIGLKPGLYDTAFCFGYFYHAINHMHLIAELALLNVSCIIIDTKIFDSPTNISDPRRTGDSA